MSQSKYLENSNHNIHIRKQCKRINYVLETDKTILYTHMHNFDELLKRLETQVARIRTAL